MRVVSGGNSLTLKIGCFQNKEERARLLQECRVSDDANSGRSSLLFGKSQTISSNSLLLRIKALRKQDFGWILGAEIPDMKGARPVRRASWDDKAAESYSIKVSRYLFEVSCRGCPKSTEYGKVESLQRTRT